MSSIVIAGDTSGSVTLQAPAVAGSSVLSLPAVTDTVAGIAATQTLTNKTLTGAVVNGTVGATTPSTGAFTTLSASGVTTVQAGTAALPAITTTGDTDTGIFFPAADTIAFSEGGAESMRIDSSGRLLVGTTSAINTETGLGVVTSTSGNPVVVFRNSRNTSGDVCLNILLGSNCQNTSSYLFQGGISGVANVIYIFGNGNVVNTNNSYGALSDVKLKENIVDATPKLADLMQVKVRSYNLIGSTTKQIGVVAQELETVFPAMIDESPDKSADGNDLGTSSKSVKYSVFVPMLIKAIQEQQALITTLTERITALEGA